MTAFGQRRLGPDKILGLRREDVVHAVVGAIIDDLAVFISVNDGRSAPRVERFGIGALFPTRSSEMLGSPRSGRTARSQQNCNEGEGKNANDDQEQREISISAGLQRSPLRIGGVDVHRYRRSDRKSLDNAFCGAFPIELNQWANDDGIASIGNAVYFVLILNHWSVVFPVEFDL
jgi:hypothetical protein